MPTSKTPMALLVSLPIALGLGAATTATAQSSAAASAAPATASAKVNRGNAAEQRAAEASCAAMKDRDSEAAAKAVSDTARDAARAPKHRKWKTNRQHREECRKTSHM